MKASLSLGMCSMMFALTWGITPAAQVPKDKNKAPAKGKDGPAEKVVQFCKSNLDKQVGNGECWTLANDALVATGLRSSPAYTDSPNKGDYVWGKQVYSAEIAKEKLAEVVTPKTTIQPGDIMQLRDSKFAGRRADGGTYEMTFSHHTAVVVGVANDGKTITALHQNYAGKKTVSEISITLSDLKAGWVKIYHPMPK